MLTLSEIALEEMEKIAADGHVCGECGGRLNVAWIKGQNVLRCGNSLDHKTITRHDYKEEKRIRSYRMESTALTKMTPKDMEVRVNMGRFANDLTPIERKSLAVLAINYGFDPAMGEMTIYQGRPYISIDGRYRKAQETGKLAGVNSMPATKEERAAWQIPDGDYFFKAVVKKREGNSVDEYTGWGRVRAGETVGKGFRPIESNPQRMAEKRAEAQALRKAFHIDLPGMEEIGTPDDPNIVESTAKVISAEQTEAKTEEQKTMAKPTYGDALTWCRNHGKQFDKKWFLDNCGFKEKELQDEPAKVETAIQNICAFTEWKWEMPTKGGV